MREGPLVVLISGFFVMWVAIVVTSLLLGSLCDEARIILSAIAAISGLLVYVYFFLTQFRRVNRYLRNVQGILDGNP